MKSYFPIFKWRFNFVCWITITSKPLCCPSLRMLGVQNSSFAVHLNNICKDRIGLFKRAWLVTH